MMSANIIISLLSLCGSGPTYPVVSSFNLKSQISLIRQKGGRITSCDTLRVERNGERDISITAQEEAQCPMIKTQKEALCPMIKNKTRETGDIFDIKAIADDIAASVIPTKEYLNKVVIAKTALTRTEDEKKRSKKSPSFFEALWGIASQGSPWEYMICMKEQGYDGVVPVDLGIIGKYNFLMNPDVVRAAIVDEASLLPRRFSVSLFETLKLDRGLVYEQGDRHKRHKRMCIPSFEQKNSMESFVGATLEELDDLSIAFGSKERIDLYAEMRKSALNVVLDVSFGLGKEGATNFKKSEVLSETIAEYLEKIVDLANEIPPLWQISPRLSKNYVRVTDVLLPTLRSLVSEVIASRRTESVGSRNRSDLLGVLVKDFNDDDILSILFDVVIAGSDTTASTTTSALYLLHQPENAIWLDKARKEAEATNAGKNIPLENIRSTMPVTVSIAREILRLYPPVPFVGRTATDDGSLCNGQFPVKNGDTFCFSPWFLGRDPTNWVAPTKFDPQRWIDDPISGGASSTFSWLPFGAGPRGCLGTRLGLMEVVLGIGRLLMDFEFIFESKGPLPVKYDLTLNLDGVMACEIQPRLQRSGD